MKKEKVLGFGSGKRLLFSLFFFLSCIIIVEGVSRSQEVEIIKGKNFYITIDYIKLLLKGMQEDERLNLLNDEFKLYKYMEFLAQVEVFYKEAKKMGIDKNPVLKAEIDLCKKKILALEALRLKIKQKMSKFKLTEGDLKLYYETHKEEFKENGKLLPFDKVKWMIREKLYEKKQAEVIKEVIEKFLKEYDVKINFDALKQLKTEKK